MSTVVDASTEGAPLEFSTSRLFALGAAVVHVRIANPYSPALSHARAMLAGVHGVRVIPNVRDEPRASLPVANVVIAELAATDRSAHATVRELSRGVASTGVLVISTRCDDEWIRAALGAGAAGVISVSVSREALVLAVKAVATGQIVLSRRALAALLALPRNAADRVGPFDQAPAQSIAGDPSHSLARLTGRERSVFRMIAEGYSAPEVGTRLSISKKTVETYKRRIGDKLGLCHRSDYVRLALAAEVLVAPRA